MTHIVLSPGSRNAPLTVSFSRHPKLELITILDERTAGFIALGIAQKTKSPVGICCTSGTALMNYGPAIAEAYYQQIPLVIFSADRPPEWIDQRDGQTINQTNPLSNFVKSFHQLPASYQHPDEQWEINRKVNISINEALLTPQGPTHINIPFREPFYPDKDQKLQFSNEVRIIENIANIDYNYDLLLDKWNNYEKKLIIIGQHEENEPLKEKLLSLSNQHSIPVITDIISNQSNDSFIQYHDLFLATKNEELLKNFRPDLVISTGKSIISKNLKSFLRTYTPQDFWHFDPASIAADTFQSLTKLIQGHLSDFLEKINNLPDQDAFKKQVQSNYHQNWTVLNKNTRKIFFEELDKSPFSEFTAMNQVLKSIPKDTDLHLGNSMPVRYANFIHELNDNVSVFANRGTSGIDGTNATAVGHALVSEKDVVLITGDLSFFYDRNAFFHQHDMHNLKIIVVNNLGGGIFRLINGPSQLEELEAHFETRHHHSAKFTAAEYGFDYFAAKDSKSLKKSLSELFKDSKEKKLLEIFTDPKQNQEVYNQIKNIIHE